MWHHWHTEWGQLPERGERTKEMLRISIKWLHSYFNMSFCVTAQGGGGKGLQRNLGFPKEILFLIPKGSGSSEKSRKKTFLGFVYLWLSWAGLEWVLKRLVSPIPGGLNHTTHITAFSLAWRKKKGMHGKVAYLGSLGHLFFCAKRPSESSAKHSLCQGSAHQPLLAQRPAWSTRNLEA